MAVGLTVAAGGADPPPPNPASPVNYVQWLNTEFAKNADAKAAGDLKAACDLYQKDGIRFEVTTQSAAKMSADERQRKVQDWLEHSRPAIELLVQAAKADRLYLNWNSESGSLIDAEQPDFATARRVCTALMARARKQVADGGLEAGLRDELTVLRVARLISEQPGISSYSFGLGIGSLAYLDILGFLGAEPDKFDAAATLKALAGDRPAAPPRRAILGEKALFCDVLQRSCKDSDGDGKLDQIAIPEGYSGKLSHPVTPAEAIKVFNEVCEAIVGMDQLRDSAAHKAGAAAHQKLRTLGELEQANRDLWNGEGMRRTFEALQNGARAALSVAAFHKANGKWPETLKEAMPGMSPTLRWDPFSDAELVYKLADGQPLLYSVGRNGQDDGGQRAPNARMGEQGDLVFMPFEK